MGIAANLLGALQIALTVLFSLEGRSRLMAAVWMAAMIGGLTSDGTLAAFAATFTATADQRSNPDQLSRSPVALTALTHQTHPETLASSG